MPQETEVDEDAEATPTSADRRYDDADAVARSPGAASCSASPGGIAAYKAIEVCRRLVDAGAHVAPVMTEGAQRFVGETTFSALASEPVQHLALGRAPTRSRTPASARAPTSSWSARPPPACSATTQRASPTTCSPPPCSPPGRRRGLPGDAHRDVGAPRGAGQPARCSPAGACTSSPPEEGRLAGGDVGAGRLADPEAIVAAVERALGPATSAGVDVLVTAGGTREPIDPVRFIGNRSSGKQGHALADEAASPGAPRSPSSPPSTGPSPPGVEVVAGRDRGRDAGRRACRAATAPTSSSWRPRWPTSGRRRRPTTRSRRTAALAVPVDPRADPRHPRRPRCTPKRPGQTLVGFAAETDDVEANAAAKLARKRRRSHRRQRRLRARRRVRARHQRGAYPVARRIDRRRRPLTTSEPSPRAVLDADRGRTAPRPTDRHNPHQTTLGAPQ